MAVLLQVNRYIETSLAARVPSRKVGLLVGNSGEVGLLVGSSGEVGVLVAAVGRWGC